MLLLFSDQIDAETGNMPTVTVLFETDPGVWEDISADLVGGDIVRGKQRELDRYQTGSATLVLRNDDRRYDPNHAGSPYNGSIKPRRRMRIQATWDGTTYDEFFGKVDRWIPDYRGPHTADVGVQLSDAFKDLARAQLASSAYAQEVLADEPSHWYRLGEPEGATQVFDTIGTRHGTVIGALGFGEEGLVDREPDTAVRTTSTATYADLGENLVGTTAWTIEFWVRRDDTDLTTLVDTTDFGSGTGAFSIYLSQDSGLTFEYRISGSGGTVTYSALDGMLVYPFTAGTRYHVAITGQTGSLPKIYIDGVEFPVDSGGLPALSSALTTRLVRLFYNVGVPAVTPNCVLDELVFYTQALSASRVAAHNAAGRTVWDGDTVGERIGRVLDAIAWPDELRDLDTGTTTLQAATLGQSALEHAQTAAASDFGLLYVTKDGRVRFEDRSNLVNQTSVATFTDEHGSDPAIITLSPEYGDDLIRNDVTISRLDGKAQNIRDTDSIDEYGRISYTLDGLYHDSDTLSLSAAEFIVSEYAEPRQRISGLTIYPKKSPAVLWPAVLGLELADKVTVAHTPQGVGDETAQASTVEGISHRFGPDQWETSLNISPALGSGDGDDCVLELDTGPCGLDDARLWF